MALTHSTAQALLHRALQRDDVSFRPGQWEAIDQLVNARARLLLVQATGWGKSMVYFLGTRALRDAGGGPTLLISPLLALMRNQEEAATRLQLNAAAINSTNPKEWTEIIARLRDGAIDLLLISPERLANTQFREQALVPVAERLGLFVVDEAHCISDWGHDFRPDYRRIARVLQFLPATIPVAATTATANNRVLEDIQRQLGSDLRIVRGPLVRASLQLQAIALPSQAARLAWLAEQIPRLPGSGIVYTLTIADAQRVAGWLQSQGIDAAAYWGGLDHDERVRLETRLLANEIKVLIATSALGMGFDKPDLGFVVHYQRPQSVVHYYQQVGRAGRAVERAYGILLGGSEDDDIADFFIESAFPPPEQVNRLLAALEAAPEGLSQRELERQLNLRFSQLDKVLKALAVESPAPVVHVDSKWRRTATAFALDLPRFEWITERRREEQVEMGAYLRSSSCLMQFLQEKLDDPAAAPCGRCGPCLGQPILPASAAVELEKQAVTYLRRQDVPIQPRSLWPSSGLPLYEFSGRIKADHAMEEGRALCMWGDAGWGAQVRREKQELGEFSGEIAAALAAMIRQRWQPQPKPTWVTCVPSVASVQLVPNLAGRVAEHLGLPFSPCLVKAHPTAPQKEMHNSDHQARNLDGAFKINLRLLRPEPVLLIDDIVDSRWTFTVIAARLRQAGVPVVHPVALASAAGLS